MPPNKSESAYCHPISVNIRHAFVSAQAQEMDVLRNARVLVTVKAYPKPSGKYEELVCTAGLLDGRRWIRIYPVPFRLLDDSEKFPKYAWIELDLERRKDKDFRPESFRPLRGVDEEIKVIKKITTKNGWSERKLYVLRSVYDSMERLIADAYSEPTVSLATLRPSRVLDVKVEHSDREWPKHWAEYLIQHDLFETAPNGQKRIIKKVPYDFSYVFETADQKRRELKIEDWELGALYWNCLRDSDSDESKAVELVRRKYRELAQSDIHLFLGTTLQYHQRRVPNPFIIIGVFYPPKDPQYMLMPNL